MALARGGRPAPGAAPLAGWPGGRAVAVYVTLNVECFIPGRPGPSLQPHLARGEDIANYGWREYGNRAGFWRLLDLFTELGTPVTAAVNGEVCRRYPAIVDAVAGAGWAVMAHGLENSTPHHGLPREVELERIAGTIGLLAAATGRRPAGWLTPGFAVTAATQELLCEAGLRYTADFGDSDHPYWLRFGDGRLLAVPYGLETNDISLLLCMHHTAGQFADAVVSHVAQLCAEGGGGAGGTVAGIGLHTFLAGQPGRLASLRECLLRIAAMPEVWLCTADEIYRLVSGEDTG